MKQPNLCVVTEYMKHGSLQDVLRATKNNARGSALKLSWRQRLGLLHSAAQGLSFLHALDPPVVHGNVKPSNLLLDDAAMASVKVCDFGFARLRQENATMTRCSKPSWTAPEIIRGEPHVPHLSSHTGVREEADVAWLVVWRRCPGVPRRRTCTVWGSSCGKSSPAASPSLDSTQPPSSALLPRSPVMTKMRSDKGMGCGSCV